MAAPTLTTRARSFVDPRGVVLVGGVVLTIGLSTLVGRQGLTLQTGALFALCIFLVVVAGFVTVPWVMVAGTIPLFALLPTLKVFVTPTIGAVKDVITAAAISAAAIVLLRRRVARHPIGVDGMVLLLVGVLLVVYAINLGGLLTGQTGHGTAWYQGVRLFFEPLGLLIVGLALPSPERTMRAASRALVASAALIAVYGVVQQAIGVNRLLSLGYVYGDQVRQISGRLRSFGTLGEPFTFASYLLLALAVLLLRSRRLGPGAYALVGVLGAGLLVSYVRTAALMALAIVGLALARRQQALAAGLLLTVAVAVAGAAFVFSSEASSTRTVPLNATTYVTLNGRANLWHEQLGNARYWLFGRGVGAVGTAAQRAQESLIGKRQVGSASSTTVVDSGYLALVADVGAFGFAVLLLLFGRLGVLARRAGPDSGNGWVALGVLLVMVIDALFRESFTAFPTAYIGMLMVGLALSAARERGVAGPS
jgi:uncharacterized membrane protein YozB (DUF420 family)